jgi:predicted site-specific integrase-resolvase
MRSLEPTNTEQHLSRRDVAQRWRTSTETVKRREREGLLKAVRFNARLIRYKLSEVERYEREALE